MKKIVYIILSAILGFLLSFILHAVIEISVIALLANDWQKYSLGLNWDQILLAHKIYTYVLSVGGLALGTWLGFKWWNYIYVLKKYRGKWFKIKE